MEEHPSDSIPPAALISQLQENLQAAIKEYELCCQTEVTVENCLMQRSNLTWLCNQCEYYLVQPAVVKISRPPKRALWQIRAIVLVGIRFKVYATLRRLLLQKKSISPLWRDLIAGLKLWILRG